MFAISIETDLAPDEVRSRLARVVGPRVRNSSATASFRPLVGRVDAASFRIRRRTARRPMWQSKISGRYAAADTGTRIVLDVPAAAPLIVIVLLSAIAAVINGDAAILGLLGVVAIIAAAAVAYDAGRAVSIVRNAVGARGLQRVCAAHSERRIA
jgi:hypothetical protein